MPLPNSIAEEFPFEENHYNLGSGLRIHFVDDGGKEKFPVIFLHGNPTWSFFYRKLIISLKNHFRCIAPDHIGCGLSDKPTSIQFSYDLKGHSSNLLELINSLKIEKFNLIVHDWGGAIGLSALRHELSRINKLVLLNTASFLSKDIPKRIRICRTPIVGEFFVRQFNGFALPATWMATSKGLSVAAKEGFLYPYRDWNSRIAIWKFIRDIPIGDAHPTTQILRETENSLSELANIPTLACWGMKDFCFHPGFLEQWQKRIPNLKSHSLMNAGHYLLEDDFVNCQKTICSFLLQ